MTPPEILTYINTGGIIAVLVYFLWLGITGKVVSRNVLDEIITAVVKAVMDELNDKRP